MENPSFWWYLFARKDGDFHGLLLLVSGRVIPQNPGLHHKIENNLHLKPAFILERFPPLKLPFFLAQKSYPLDLPPTQ